MFNFILNKKIFECKYLSVSLYENNFSFFINLNVFSDMEE